MVAQIMQNRTWKEEEMAKEKKRKVGRPKVLPPDLIKRFQIRCSVKDIEVWTERAIEQGYGNVSAWIRKVANDAMKQPAK